MATETTVHQTEDAPTGFPFPPASRRRGLRLRRADFHTEWRTEIALLNSTTKRVATAVLLVILAIVPFLVDTTLRRVATLAMIAAIAAIGLSLVAGVAGQLSLGHAAFLGIGAYSAAYVTTDLELSFFVSLPVAAVIAGFFGLLLAPLALRLKGLYLAVVTLGFVFVMQHVFRSATGITGGVGGKRIATPELFGLNLVRGGEVFGIEVATGVPYYFLVLLFLIGTTVVTKNLLRSRTGRSFAAVRDHDIAAGVVGVAVFGAKTRAFVISSAITGVAGALMAGLLRVTNFDQWNLLVSVDYLAMVIIGGLGTVLGAILGAVFITAMPEAFDRMAPYLPFISTDPGVGLTATRLSRVFYGLLLAAVMVFEPLGLVGIWLRIKTYFMTWPFSR
jgi:branched-chain amino acid transport system permease protein